MTYKIPSEYDFKPESFLVTKKGICLTDEWELCDEWYDAAIVTVEKYGVKESPEQIRRLIMMEADNFLEYYAGENCNPRWKHKKNWKLAWLKWVRQNIAKRRIYK